MKYLQRISEIDRQVRAGKCPTSRDLAHDLNVTERQIYLDRRAMEAMGAQIITHKKRGGWVYADPTFVLPTVWLSEGEILAFFLSVEIARATGNAGFSIPLDKVIAKIKNGLGELVSVDLNTLRDATNYALSPAARADAQTCFDLRRAGAARQKLRIHYYTAGRNEWNERVIHPYHLHFARGEWILFAFDENRQKVRCFNIARISRLDFLTEHFLQLPDFNAEDMCRSMLWAEAGVQTFSIAIRFDEYQTRYIKERTWHPDQILEALPDGASIVSFPASGLPEVARWVLGYGKHAEVLEPPELRAIMAAHIEEMARIYGGGK